MARERARAGKRAPGWGPTAWLGSRCTHGHAGSTLTPAWTLVPCDGPRGHSPYSLPQGAPPTGQARWVSPSPDPALAKVLPCWPTIPTAQAPALAPASPFPRAHFQPSLTVPTWVRLQSASETAREADWGRVSPATPDPRLPLGLPEGLSPSAHRQPHPRTNS